MTEEQEPLHRRRTPRVTPEALLREQEAREKLLAGLTPAEARAKRIELEMYVCPTECDDDCDAPCHESHEVIQKRMHPVEICEANVARGKPPIPVDWYPTGCSCYACDGPYMPTFKEFVEGLRITAETPRPPMSDDPEDENMRVSFRMSLCPVCGFKRCPGAADHEHRCTGSNAPGQPGSLYPPLKRTEGTPRPVSNATIELHEALVDEEEATRDHPLFNVPIHTRGPLEGQPIDPEERE